MKLIIISVSVNYLDILKISHYFNKQKQINKYNYHIITSESDNNTIQFCKENKLNCWTTNAFYIKNSKFNKGAALNVFFQEYIKKEINNLNWIALIDSDIIVNDTFNDFLASTTTNTLQNYCDDPLDHNYTEYLYSCPRRIYNSPQDFSNGKYYTESMLDFIGYFQLFHVSKIKKDILSNSPIFFENTNACRYDDIFRDRYWPNRQDRKRLKGVVDHLGPIATNWNGRTSASWSDLHQYLNE